jgi:hypothetical protein
MKRYLDTGGRRKIGAFKSKSATGAGKTWRTKGTDIKVGLSSERNLISWIPQRSLTLRRGTSPRLNRSSK